MLRRLMATLWTLPDGTRCDLIALVPSGWNLLVYSKWQLEVVRGEERLRLDSFEQIDLAYRTSIDWRHAAERTHQADVPRSA
jgi:hypothetical protein